MSNRNEIILYEQSVELGGFRIGQDLCDAALLDLQLVLQLPWQASTARAKIASLKTLGLFYKLALEERQLMIAETRLEIDQDKHRILTQEVERLTERIAELEAIKNRGVASPAS